METISVLMSVYNESDAEIRAASNSILNQTYEDIQFVVILDNPGNERLRRVLDEYSQRDARFQYHVNEKNLGLAQSLNRGIEKCRGDIIARMDADDVSEADRLEKEYRFLCSKGCDMVFSNRTDINESGDVLNEPDMSYINEDNLREILGILCIVNHPSVMIRKECLDALHGYRKLKAAQDYDLWLRMLSSGYEIGFLDERLIRYRIRTGSISGKKAYIQYLTSVYVKKLYRERMKKGWDSYNEKTYQDYLEAHNACTEERNLRFAKAQSGYYRGMEMLKERKPMGAVRIAGALIQYPVLSAVLSDNVKLRKYK